VPGDGRAQVLFALLLLAGCVPGYTLRTESPVGVCARGGPGEAVRWVVPTEGPERARLDAWCGAAGPPVFVGTPYAPVADSGDLVVVTWNVHAGSGDLVALLRQLGVSCGETGPVAGTARARTGAAPGELGASPRLVVLVQEAWRGGPPVPPPPPGVPLPSRIDKAPPDGPRIGTPEVAERCGLAVLYVPSMRNGAGRGPDSEDRGNAILSTLPLTRPAAIELPLETQRRVAVSAVVDGPGDVPLRVTSLHLDVASSLLRVLRTGNATRVRQGLATADALDTLDAAEPGIASLMAGDLNTWTADETVVQRLRLRFPESPPPPEESTRGDFVTDHVFFRTDEAGRLEVVPGSVRVLPDARGSDHRPLLLRLVPRRTGGDLGG
jgi:endonuclease/exonuclease/phosphatase family metal-dependent hydrolase